MPCRPCPGAAQGRINEAFEHSCTGHETWLVTKTAGTYLDLDQDVLPGGKQQLVYLTADSPHELEELNTGKAYIVGGIVDRNRHKRLCLDKAEREVRW